MERRRFLIATGAAMVAAPLAGCMNTPAEKEPRRLKNIGLQLSTLTPLMVSDFEGTLQLVAEIGYDQVEFSALGFLGRDPEYIVDLLGSNDLTAPQGRISPRLPVGFFGLPRDQLEPAAGR